MTGLLHRRAVALRRAAPPRRHWLTLPSGRSAFYGMRVAIHSGPREGKLGTVLRARSARQYEVMLDEGGCVTVLRSAVLAIDAMPPRPPRGESRRGPGRTIERRILALFAADPSLDRVVVYRTDSGRTCVRPWHEQEVGPGLIGVYARGVDPALVDEDLRP